MTMTEQNATRRKYLSALAGASTAGLAGCSLIGGGSSGDDSSGNDSSGNDSSDASVGQDVNSEDGEVTVNREVVDEIRPLTRIENGVQVGYLEVSLLRNHGIEKMSIVDDGNEIRTTSVDIGAREIYLETGRDVEGANVLAAGNYTLASQAEGQVVGEHSITLEKEVRIENVELAHDNPDNEQQDLTGFTTFRFDIVNVGDLPIDIKEGYVTGEVPSPGERDGIRQELIVENKSFDGWSGPSDGFLTVESFPKSGPTTVLIRDTPLEAPAGEEITSKYCDGATKEATIHLRGKTGYEKEVIVKFAPLEVFGDNCLRGEVESVQPSSG